MKELTCTVPWGRGRGKATHRGEKTQMLRGGMRHQSQKKSNYNGEKTYLVSRKKDSGD